MTPPGARLAPEMRSQSSRPAQPEISDRQPPTGSLDRRPVEQYGHGTAPADQAGSGGRPLGAPVLIRPGDRISRVLDLDARLLDELIEISWIFERLRDPEVRRTMGRLVTVEQAAGVAGVPLEVVLGRLNGVLLRPRTTQR